MASKDQPLPSDAEEEYILPKGCSTVPKRSSLPSTEAESLQLDERSQGRNQSRKSAAGPCALLIGITVVVVTAMTFARELVAHRQLRGHVSSLPRRALKHLMASTTTETTNGPMSTSFIPEQLPTSTTRSIWDLPEDLPILEKLRYVRFKPTGLRGGKNQSCVQISEIAFRNTDGKDLKIVHARAMGGFPERPNRDDSEVFDHNTKTKWYRCNVSYLLIDLGEDYKLGSFSFTTADDMPSRDPVQWRLEGSKGRGWQELNVTEDHRTPEARFTQTEWFQFRWRSMLPLLPLPPPQKIPGPLRKLRIVLFMTTVDHDALHREFLKRCWAHAVRNSALLMQVETVIFYTTKQPTPDLLEAFTGKNVTVKLFKNPGWQAGAILSMVESTSQEFFAGYDWMIKVNPDVLILDNDKFLIENMINPDVDGIFADCWDSECRQHCSKRNIHINSDFYAVRVKALPKDAFTQFRKIYHAETLATNAFKNITSAGRDRFLIGTKMWPSCRVRGNLSVPVFHSHTVQKLCPLRRGEPLNRSGISDDRNNR